MLNNNYVKTKIFILLLLLDISIFQNYILFYYYIKFENKNSSIHRNYLNKLIKKSHNISIYYNLFDIKFFYSKQLNIIEVKYIIKLYDNYKNLIIPSDLILYKKLHIFCYIKIINENNDIYSFPNILFNSYYECVEFFKFNEKINFGIKIYKSNNDIFEKIEDFFINIAYINIFNYNNLLFTKVEKFEYIITIKEYTNIIKKINHKNINKNYQFKKLYIRFPLNNLKRFTISENVWHFTNFYNNYFCFCKGEYCFEKNFQSCKYFFYLYIIDQNKNIYEKKNYLFFDFILSEYSSVDVYPVFKAMLINNKPVHYLTANIDIYNQYCNQKEKCLSVIYVNDNNYTINGDFIEKHLTLILKLKQVISSGGVSINYINNLFYNLEYITYICMGHGVSYLKPFLYASYAWYGYKIFDKIVIPPSKKLISIAKNFGWNDENIIKINLPRWDNYNNPNSFISDDNIYNNSIFIMFTWRRFKKGKYLSNYYFKNIYNLINNELLNNILKIHKINLLFSLHHKLNIYKMKFKNNKYIHFIEEKEISRCLSIINLVISDFSSIIFDIIYRRKPFIIYIPDANDPEIEKIYDKNYYELIKSLQNGTIYFENKFFQTRQVINKIIYYIDNNYNLDKNLEIFYDSFEFKRGNNTNTFIKYITNI